jgi:hypothetical protein
LIHKAALLALQLAFLVFVEAFERHLFANLAATGISLVFTECWLVGKSEATAVALDWKEVTSIEVFSVSSQQSVLAWW